MQLKKRILEYLRLPLIHVVAELIRLRRTTSVLLLHNLAKGPYRGAHKGAWGLPENTYESVKAAYEQGYPIVEVDIAETADNVIVLLHDDTIDRTSNGSGKVLEMTYQQLSAFDFSGTDIVEDLYGGGENQCVTIPTLASILTLVKQYGGILNLDVARHDRIKRDSYKRIVKLIRTFHMENQVYIEIDCSVSNVIKWLWYAPDLIYEFANVSTEKTFRKILPFAKSLSDAVVLTREINPKIVQLAHDNNLLVSFWTAHNDQTMQLAISGKYDIIGCEF